MTPPVSPDAFAYARPAGSLNRTPVTATSAARIDPAPTNVVIAHATSPASLSSTSLSRPAPSSPTNVAQAGSLPVLHNETLASQAQIAYASRFPGNPNSPFLAGSSDLPLTTPSISPLVLSAASSPLPSPSHLPRTPALQANRTLSPSPTLSARSRASPEPPLSPADSEREGSGSESDDSSDASSSRFMTPEPLNQWEVDKRLGLPLHDRVYRERLRLEAAESNVALVKTPRPTLAEITEEAAPVHAGGFTHSPGGKSRCSRCEGLKPLDCARANEMRHPDNFSDEPTSSIFTRRIPSPLRSDTASLPCSPLAVGTPLSATMNPWSSTVTLSSSSVMSPSSKPSGLLKRKESVILRKLFGGKGKESESPPPSEVTVKEEPLGSWEVVDDDLQVTSYATRPQLNRDQFSASSWIPIAAPTSPVFLNRPVRPIIRSGVTPQASPCTPSTLRNSPTGSQMSASEPSPSERPAKPRRKPPPPPPPRKLRPSPSVVWKTGSGEGASPSTQSPSADASEPADKLPFPSSASIKSPRSRAASSLTLLTVPRMLPYDGAGPSTHSDSDVPESAVPHTPTFATALAPSSSNSPPASPSTPNHHYPGRPLPQVPHEPSPLGRPICPSLSPTITSS